MAWVLSLVLGAACASAGQGQVPVPVNSGPASAPSSVAPTRITAAIRGAPQTIGQERVSPQGTGGSVPGLDALQELVQAGLVHSDASARLGPQLAEAVPSIENGLWALFPDGRMETRWQIKPIARWHDGAVLTSDDLTFAMTIEQDRELNIPRHRAYDLIERVETPAADAVIVTWKQPYIEAASLFSYEVALPLPRHVLEGPYADNKASFFSLPVWNHEFIGSGPYRVREWVTDSHVVLEANELYVLGRPKIDQIELKLIPDPNTLLANVLAGLDVTMGRALSLEQAFQVADEWKARGGQVVYKGNIWLRITPQFINPSPQIVGDVRFRRAMLEAIDRQEIVDSLMGGMTSIAHSFVDPGTSEYNDVEANIVRYDYDLRRAGQAIEALGYGRGRDGLFRDAAGQPLTVEARTTVQNANHPKALAIVSDAWQRIGVTVDQVLVPVQRTGDPVYRANYPAFDLAQLATDVTARGVQRYYSSAAAVAENAYLSRGNESRYMSADLDGLIGRYVTTVPRAERMQVLGQIVQHQTSQVIIMGLSFALMPTMASARMRNVTQGNWGGAVRSSEAWNVQVWDVAAL